MEQMIQDYQAVYCAIRDRMKELRHQLLTQTMKTKERETIKGRIEVMQEERVELVHTIAELKKHL